MNWKKFDIFSFGDRKFLWTFLIAAVVLYLPLLIWNEWPQRDVTFRYAPMADAFARGDFQYAFHPRCQMMLPLCAGIVCALTGVSGFMACKIVALIFFILGALPLYSLTKTVFSRKTAVGAVLLYLFCFHIIDEMVATGVRDMLKSFFLLWMSREFMLVFLERRAYRHYVKLGLACGLGICVRGEMLFIAATVMFLCGVLDGLENRWLRRSAVGLLCAVAGASVEMLTNLAICGYAVPSVRFVTLFQEVFHADPTLLRFYLYAVLPAFPVYFAVCHATVFMLTDPLRKKIFAILLAVAAVGLLVHIVAATPADARGGLVKFFRGIHNGCAPVFYPPALLGVLTMLWLREWNSARRWVAALFFTFNGLVIGQIIFYDHCYYLASRYLLPTAPLMLPWSAIGIATLWELVKFSRVPFPRVIAGGTVAFAIVLSLYLSYRTELLNRYREKEVKDWQTIQEIKQRLSGRKKRFYTPKMDISYYKSNIAPTVFSYQISYYSVATYMAGLSEVKKIGEADIVVGCASERAIRKNLKFKRRMRRLGRPIPSRRGNISIWEIVK